MQKDKKIGIDLTEGSIMKTLIIYALPLLLTNFVQQLYNTVDMAVIGHYVGSTGTVGVSTGGDIVAFLTFFGTSFGAAAQIYIAQLAGAKKRDKISSTIGTTLTLMFLVSIAFMVICIIFAEPFLNLLNCPAEAMDQAKSYMIITAIGLPFIFEYNAISGILRGMGESKRPLLFVTIAAVSNIFMDILFVAVIPLESAGTAIATVAAQFSSCIASLIFLYKKRELFDFDFKLPSFRMEKEHLAVLMKIGLPMSARMMCIQGSQMFCASLINNYGLTISALNSVGKKLGRLVNIFSASIDQGAGAMCGQCIGAGKLDRAKKTVYVTMLFCAFFAALQIVLALFAPKLVFYVFTTDEAVLAMADTYMKILIIKFVLEVFQGPYTAIVTGSGNAMLSFIGGITDGVIFRITFSMLFAYVFDMGYYGFAIGDCLAHLGVVIPSAIYFYSGKWKTHKLIKE